MECTESSQSRIEWKGRVVDIVVHNSRRMAGDVPKRQHLDTARTVLWSTPTYSQDLVYYGLGLRNRDKIISDRIPPVSYCSCSSASCRLRPMRRIRVSAGSWHQRRSSTSSRL